MCNSKLEKVSCYTEASTWDRFIFIFWPFSWSQKHIEKFRWMIILQVIAAVFFFLHSIQVWNTELFIDKTPAGSVLEDWSNTILINDK